MKKQQRTVGAFISICLPDERIGYGRILEKASYGIYDLISDKTISDIEIIQGSKILFIIAVYDQAVKSGRWQKIGTRPLEDHLTVLPLEYSEDAIKKGSYSIYDPNSGEFKAAVKEDCLGLERAAVWAPEHVEERILDHFNNKENVWLKQWDIS